MKITEKDFYQERFNNLENQQRDEVWRALVDFFLQKYVNDADRIVDLGAGYCEFINNVRCKTKIAVDINPDTKKFAHKDVKVITSKVTDLPASLNGKVDVVFMSNFLEHLLTKGQVLDVLARSYQLLASGGKIMIFQPNISLVGGAYWDFIDHSVALNETSMVEALNVVGFKVEKLITKCLPYTSKTILPKNRWLVWLYLQIPPSLRPMAGQSFVLAIKP